MYDGEGESKKCWCDCQKRKHFILTQKSPFESTNSNELFSKMKETLLESLAKFQRQGSN